MKMLPLFAALLLPVAVHAQPVRTMTEIKAGQPVTIRPDAAYILIRTDRLDGVPTIEPVFMRVPSSAEMEAYEAAKREAYAKAEPGLIKEREKRLRRKAEAEAAGKPFKDAVPPPPRLETFTFEYRDAVNVQTIDDSRAFIKGKPESVFLVEAPPGEYVLYGASFAGGSAGLHTCFCLGTVGFEAAPGVVTDLGTFVADRVKSVSNVPELKVESGFGPSSDVFLYLLAGTVRPATANTRRPDALQGATVRPADYHAVGKFFDPRSYGINRLVPIPGVLDYDGGRVLDVKSGKVAEDHL